MLFILLVFSVALCLPPVFGGIVFPILLVFSVALCLPQVLVGSVMPILLVFSVALCLPQVFGGIRVAHMVSFLCCTVFTPGLWWDLCYPYC